MGNAQSTKVRRSSTIYLTASHIPSEVLRSNTLLPCQVVNVADGDSIRVRHTPRGKLGRNALTPFPKGADWRARTKAEPWRSRLKEETILVRIYAVDAPETAKNGHAGQLYATEATKFVEEVCLEQVVYLKLFGKDQYGRVIAAVIYKKGPGGLLGFFCRACVGVSSKGDVSEDLLKQGFATVYRGRGAEYGGHADKFNKLEEAAKERKKGMWSVPSTDLVDPAEYKRKLKAGMGKQ